MREEEGLERKQNTYEDNRPYAAAQRLIPVEDCEGSGVPTLYCRVGLDAIPLQRESKLTLELSRSVRKAPSDYRFDDPVQGLNVETITFSELVLDLLSRCLQR